MWWRVHAPSTSPQFGNFPGTKCNFDGALPTDKQDNWTILVAAMHFLNEYINFMPLADIWFCRGNVLALILEIGGLVVCAYFCNVQSPFQWTIIFVEFVGAMCKCSALAVSFFFVTGGEMQSQTSICIVLLIRLPCQP
jgi:hypothetical protein